MADLDENSGQEDPVTAGKPSEVVEGRRGHNLAIKALILLVVFSVGGVGGYFVGTKLVHQVSAEGNPTPNRDQVMVDMDQVNPPDGYQIQAVFGDIGPKMVAAGAIDMAKFSGVYKQQNKPLTEAQISILTQGSQDNVMINPENAYFLLNFFWAFGLTNQDAILTTGPMVSQGIDKVGGFASTGGWTLGSKSPMELYASTKIITLTDEQHARLLEVASGVYRPCCNNPTHFPDCNHGMAMLGLLELMASQDASVDVMFQAAKYVTAFWYPQQMLEVATVFKAAQKGDFVKADARTMLGAQFASVSGFQSVHKWLAENGLLERATSSGGSCGVQ